MLIKGSKGFHRSLQSFVCLSFSRISNKCMLLIKSIFSIIHTVTL